MSEPADGLGGEARHPIGYLLDDSRAVALANKVRERGAEDLGVTRAVIFLTNACNMSCRYCRSKAHAVPPWHEERLRQFLKALAAGGTKHIQWTGGEVTLQPGFTELVACSTALGMGNSISTNGTASVEKYLALAQAGVGHFFISLDLLDPQGFDAVTGTRGLLPKIAGTIEALCRRKENERFRVVINSVLTKDTAAALLQDGGRPLREWLRWCQRLGADDFKFLPASTELDAFADDAGRRRFLEICAAEVPARYAFFHYRLERLAAGGHGLRGRARHACYHGLDDRAFDSLGAYPCVIQLREGGERIYRHDEDAEAQAAGLRRFFETDRLGDPLCRQFCFDVYRDLSDRAAALLGRPNQ